MFDSRWSNRRSWPDDETNFRGYGHCSDYPEFFPQPTIPQPIGCTHRAGDRVVAGSDVGRDVRREGALLGTTTQACPFQSEGTK